jgi:hypothetical protein
LGQKLPLDKVENRRPALLLGLFDLLFLLVIIIIESRKRCCQAGLKVVEMHSSPSLCGIARMASAQPGNVAFGR